jgi:hypothetical protein
MVPYSSATVVSYYAALDISSEPAPRHRPWITPQGETPAERIEP